MILIAAICATSLAIVEAIAIWHLLNRINLLESDRVWTFKKLLECQRTADLLKHHNKP